MMEFLFIYTRKQHNDDEYNVLEGRAHFIEGYIARHTRIEKIYIKHKSLATYSILEAAGSMLLMKVKKLVTSMLNKSSLTFSSSKKRKKTSRTGLTKRWMGGVVIHNSSSSSSSSSSSIAASGKHYREPDPSAHTIRRTDIHVR